MVADAETADYIVVGGGLTGCAVASLLSRSDKGPSPSVILLEAGPDPAGNEAAAGILSALALTGGDLDYTYQSEPEPTTVGRVHTLNAGKVLGGGSVLNYASWLHSDKKDYDDWANLLGDQRWSYQGLLPWFRKTEHFHYPTSGPGDSVVQSGQYGTDGPMHVFPVSASESATGGRKYLLREHIKDAWLQLGVKPNFDKKGGSTRGITEMYENTDEQGMRQPSQKVFPLDKVRVLTNTPVARVIWDLSGTTPKATGVELHDGTKITAKKEVILSAGTYRTPQLLLLSGIGPSDTLTKHGISIVHESPEVGTNMHDHYALFLAFRLRDPSQGYGLGSNHPAWTNNPAIFKYFPWDWVVTETLSKELGAKHKLPWASSNSDEEVRNQFEVMTMYVPPPIPGIPMDGTHIATSTMLLRPTSRGSVTIRSANPADPPQIQPRYLETEFDKDTLVYAARQTLRAFLETDALKGIVAQESPPKIPGLELVPLGPDSTDEQIEERVRMTGSQHHHSGGTAAMGKVVDTEGRVLGVKGLRVADASILPIPMGGHLQATLYAVAGQLASLILEDNQ